FPAASRGATAPRLASRAGGAGGLLAEDGHARGTLAELAVDQLLDARVPLGDEVGRVLLGAHLAGVAPPADELGGGQRGDLERDVAGGFRRHRSSRIATALRAVSRKLGEAGPAASMVARSMARKPTFSAKKSLAVSVRR